MATIQPVAFITTQPMAAGNPFKQMNGDWSVGLCDCCNDTSQCKIFLVLWERKTNSFDVGLYAMCCWQCFMCSLASKVDEPCVSTCFVPSALAVYRMKIRAVLRIQVRRRDDFSSTIRRDFLLGRLVQRLLRDVLLAVLCRSANGQRVENSWPDALNHLVRRTKSWTRIFNRCFSSVAICIAE